MTDVLPCFCLHESEGCPAVGELQRLRERVQSLESQVIRDPLTGLYNKGHFDKVLETEMERSRRSLQPLSLILADLDHFKSINDRFGHLNGDRVLHSAASTLKAELRMIDVPCRYGGEEFAIILPTTPLVTAVQVAERLRSALKNHHFDLEHGPLSLTASFGVSTFCNYEHSTPALLIQHADQKLYDAKRGGRDRVCATLEAAARSHVGEAERAALLEDDRSP